MCWAWALVLEAQLRKSIDFLSFISIFFSSSSLFFSFFFLLSEQRGKKGGPAWWCVGGDMAGPVVVIGRLGSTAWGIDASRRRCEHEGGGDDSSVWTCSIGDGRETTGQRLGLMVSSLAAK